MSMFRLCSQQKYGGAFAIALTVVSESQRGVNSSKATRFCTDDLKPQILDFIAYFNCAFANLSNGSLSAFLNLIKLLSYFHRTALVDLPITLY